MIRLIVCIDVDTDDLPEAYRLVRRIMYGEPAASPSWDWETSDEWYWFGEGTDVDMDPDPPAELQEAIMQVFREDNPSPGEPDESAP